MSYIEMIEKAFPNMTSHLKPCESKHFAIEHFVVTDEDVKHCQLIDAIHGRREYYGFKAGLYVRLRRLGLPFGDGIMMSDTFMEKQTNYDVVKNAHGDVLIAGLGIGMVLLAVRDLPNVTSVTVVEKEQEIIDLVKPQLHLSGIIHEDIFNYVPKTKFDTIYFDIWDNICGDDWENVKKLHRKFRSKLRANGWMSSWRKEDFQYAARGC